MNEQEMLQGIVNKMVDKVKNGESKKDVLEDSEIKRSFQEFKKYVTSPHYKRVLYNNYDTWKYRIHNLSYGIVIYKKVAYDADDSYDRGKLIHQLVQDKIIKGDPKQDAYQIVSKGVICELLEHFRYIKERNQNLNRRAIILNLKKTFLLDVVQ